MKNISVPVLPGDRVKLLHIENVSALVEELSIRTGSIYYKVAYWIDGKRNTEWITESEFSL